MIRRGHELGLQIIIVFKVVKALILVAIGVCGLVFSKTHLYSTAEDLVTSLGLNAGRSTIRKLLDISDKRVHLMAVGSLAYACVFAVEAWFLHRRKVWAEWFTVVVTASLIPFEIYELVHEPSAGKVATLIGNIVVVIYLVIRRLRS